MFCSQCGTQVMPDHAFCNRCGAPAPDAFLPPRGASPSPYSHAQLIQGIEHRINRLAGTEKLEGFSLGQMFSDVFKKRTQDELDEYFITGTARTTPPLRDVQCGWPHPWFFMRVLSFVVAAYAILAFTFDVTHNINLVPGLIVMGAFAMPLSTLFLFFELNSPRNVPFHGVISLFCLGGVASLFITIVVVDPMLNILSWMGASSAGVTEEISKLLTVVLLARNRKTNYILNGLLFGAAVGAGFGAFESAGYAFRVGLQDVNSMNTSILLRAALAPFMHVAWTAIAGGALWRSKGDRPLSLHAANGRFWKTLLIPVGLHIIWNSPLQLPFFLTQIAVGSVGWYVVFALTQQGLRQVREAQLAAETDLGGSNAMTAHAL